MVVASSLPTPFWHHHGEHRRSPISPSWSRPVVVGLAAYYLRSFRSGRELYAMGSNPDAARLAGIPTGKRVFTAFVSRGGIAGLAGVLWAATLRHDRLDGRHGL